MKKFSSNTPVVIAPPSTSETSLPFVEWLSADTDKYSSLLLKETLLLRCERPSFSGMDS